MSSSRSVPPPPPPPVIEFDQNFTSISQRFHSQAQVILRDRHNDRTTYEWPIHPVTKESINVNSFSFGHHYSRSNLSVRFVRTTKSIKSITKRSNNKVNNNGNNSRIPQNPNQNSQIYTNAYDTGICLLPLHFNSVDYNVTLYPPHPLYRHVKGNIEHLIRSAEFDHPDLLDSTLEHRGSESVTIKRTGLPIVGFTIVSLLRLLHYQYPQQLTASQSGLFLRPSGSASTAQSQQIGDPKNSAYWHAYQSILQLDEGSVEFSRRRLLGALDQRGRLTVWQTYLTAHLEESTGNSRATAKHSGESQLNDWAQSVVIFDVGALKQCFVRKLPESKRGARRKKRENAQKSEAELAAEQFAAAMQPIKMLVRSHKQTTEMEYLFSPSQFSRLMQQALIASSIAVVNQVLKAILFGKASDLQPEAPLPFEDPLKRSNGDGTTEEDDDEENVDEDDVIDHISGDHVSIIEDSVGHRYYSLLDCLIAAFESTGNIRYRALHQLLSRPPRSSQLEMLKTRFAQPMCLNSFFDVPSFVPSFAYRTVYVRRWNHLDLQEVEKYLRKEHSWLTNQRYRFARDSSGKLLDGDRIGQAGCRCSYCVWQPYALSTKQAFRVRGKWDMAAAEHESQLIDPAKGKEDIQIQSDNEWDEHEEAEADRIWDNYWLEWEEYMEKEENWEEIDNEDENHEEKDDEQENENGLKDESPFESPAIGTPFYEFEFPPIAPLASEWKLDSDSLPADHSKPAGPAPTPLVPLSSWSSLVQQKFPSMPSATGVAIRLPQRHSPPKSHAIPVVHSRGVSDSLPSSVPMLTPASSVSSNASDSSFVHVSASESPVLVGSGSGLDPDPLSRHSSGASDFEHIGSISRSESNSSSAEQEEKKDDGNAADAGSASSAAPASSDPNANCSIQ